MATLSLRDAAEQAGVSKSTIFRAIKSGRMSAPRTDDGGFAIDPAELFRVYPAKAGAVAAERAEQRCAGQDATASAMAGTGAVAPDVTAKLAAMEAELSGLRDMVAELRASRDSWQAQTDKAMDAARAATLALTGHRQRDGRPWWRRLAG